jgi:DNA-binding LytR/AlgR family response regulator
MEVCGTFDLIIQGRWSDVEEYTLEMERLRKPLAEFVTRIETNFVARTMDRPAPDSCSGALWLPCKDGRRRVEYRQIDKIVAEGDYMRVHVGDWNCLLHDTMAHLAKELASAGFVQLHRSWLVRIDFIEKLVHDQRRWTARLVDGTEVGVAKRHTHSVLRIMSGESSTLDGHSPKPSPFGDILAAASENLMKVPL